MNMTLLRCCIALLLAGCGLVWTRPAQATISCQNVAMSPVTFGNVNPQSSQTNAGATLTFTCSNNFIFTTVSAKVCFSIGEPGGGPTNPRLMNDGASHVLAFQLYQDAARTQPWGSQGFGTFRTPLQFDMTLGPGVSQNYSVPLYGQVVNGQTTATPGSYSDNYQAGDTATSINQQNGNTAPATCAAGYTGGLVFPFNVTASIVKQCTVTAGPTLNLGNPAGVDATLTNIAGNNTINVTCTTGTPYYVGLAPSNGNMTGAGLMAGTGSNTDKVPYQLRSTAGMAGAIWGNTATATSVGNGVAGTGNGSSQSLSVYATAPSADFTPDTYTDIVTINVNY